ncbi:hypothetical protein [Streptococcus pneumoniae]|nr:hypothetical protein [Streptococcus pneumoniae]
MLLYNGFITNTLRKSLQTSQLRLAVGMVTDFVQFIYNLKQSIYNLKTVF